MKSNNFKHAYSLILLVLTFIWAVFCVWVTWQATKLLNPANIIAAAGCDTLLGALISWNALVIQHYFRKSVPEDNPDTKK
jgi:uncharacterized membrane protein